MTLHHIAHRLTIYITRFDRNVPVMYNSLDVNSQEPLLYENNSLSQSNVPKSPDKEDSYPPPKQTTPGFNSRKLLFLSPLPNKATAASSAVAKTLALLPTNSPNLTSQSDDAEPSVSRYNVMWTLDPCYLLFLLDVVTSNHSLQCKSRK